MSGVRWRRVGLALCVVAGMSASPSAVGARPLARPDTSSHQVFHLPSASQTGQWGPLLTWPLVAIHSALLPNGKVMVWDRVSRSGLQELWDPSTGTFTSKPLATQTFCSGQVLLADGRLLVMGGSAGAEVGTRATYLYDPSSDTWTRAADMFVARWYPTALRLTDGRVLVLSGQISPGVWANTPEVYDPVSNTWTELSSVNTADIRESNYPDAYLLPNGKVFVYGELSGRVRILDVGAGTWTKAPSSPIHNGSITMYAPGRFLVTGGGAPNGSAQPTAAVIDMTATVPKWQQVSPMALGRFDHVLVTLPDGTVLAVGGTTVVNDNSTGPVLPSELWSPSTGSWSTMDAIGAPRMYHSTAILLPDGTVLAAGGGRLNSNPNELSAQVYSPPYLFNGPRPTITSAPASITYGSAFTVRTPNATAVSSVVLMSLATETHTLDMNQRRVPLSFAVHDSTDLAVTAPAGADLAPGGDYLLFVLNSAGVPSVATTISVG